MRSTPLKDFNMLRIKKGVDPVGTFQFVRKQVAAVYSDHRYKVIEVIGNKSHGPNTDPPIIYMELAEKSTGLLEQIISLPLSCFPGRVKPVFDTDEFWEQIKTGTV